VWLDYMNVNRPNVSQFDKNDPDTLVGVIARSAGVWDSKCFSYLLATVEVRCLVRNRADRVRPQMTKRYARVLGRPSGRSAKSSAIVACCKLEVSPR
jgi:hypothetical protein